MSNFDKWAERLYAETDFGRSIATSVAGMVGLGAYLFSHDWVIAAFLAVIVFPIARVVASGTRSWVAARAAQRAGQVQAEDSFDSLSEEERIAVAAFISAGGCVLTWGQMNASPATANAVESLIQRGMVSTSITADGMRETFVLTTELFDAAQRRLGATRAVVAGGAVAALPQ